MPKPWTLYEPWKSGEQLGSKLNEVWANLFPDLVTLATAESGQTNALGIPEAPRPTRKARQEQVNATIAALIRSVRAEECILLGYQLPIIPGDGPVEVPFDALREKIDWHKGTIDSRLGKFSNVRAVPRYEYDGACAFDEHGPPRESDAWTAKLSQPNPEPTIEFDPASPFASSPSGRFDAPLPTGRRSQKPYLIAAIEKLEGLGELDTNYAPYKPKYERIRETARSMYPHLPKTNTGMSDQTIREAWHEARARKQKTQ